MPYQMEELLVLRLKADEALREWRDFTVKPGAMTKTLHEEKRQKLKKRMLDLIAKYDKAMNKSKREVANDA